MITATITEAKNGLSALIDRVRAGETVVVTDRGVPVARIEPVTLAGDDDGRLGRLVRTGVVRPPRAELPDAFLAEPPPEPARPVDLVAIVLDERRSSW
jgi:prevent-host-death family protein